MNPSKALYNEIGNDYSQFRQQDETLYQKILSHLENSSTVLNVGAGAGSYEPDNKTVVALEPSEVMVAQRKNKLVPVVKAFADQLPFHDKTFDAAMTVLSMHHWLPHQQKGIEEMVRVARKKIVIVTCDPRVSEKMWLMTDYFSELAQLDHEVFPWPETICQWIGADTQIETLPISRHTPDWSMMSYWAHPERVLDSAARAATSGFAKQPQSVVNRVVSNVENDLNSGAWDKRHGHLRDLDSMDVGLRIISANLKDQ